MSDHIIEITTDNFDDMVINSSNEVSPFFNKSKATMDVIILVIEAG